jgi:hypothetical protein
MSLYFSEPSASSRTSEVDDISIAASFEPDTQASKKADLACPGIGDYAELEKILPQDYNPSSDTPTNTKSDFPLAPLYRRQSMQRTRPDDGSGPADRRRRKRRQ